MLHSMLRIEIGVWLFDIFIIGNWRQRSNSRACGQYGLCSVCLPGRPCWNQPQVSSCRRRGRTATVRYCKILKVGLGEKRHMVYLCNVGVRRIGVECGSVGGARRCGRGAGRLERTCASKFLVGQYCTYGNRYWSYWSPLPHARLRSATRYTIHMHSHISALSYSYVTNMSHFLRDQFIITYFCLCP